MSGTTIDELKLGMAAELTRAYDEWDVYTFAALTGDLKPARVDQASAEQTRIAHGMLTASLISAVVGTRLPGPGSIHLTQSLKFLRPVRVGDTVTARVAVIEIVKEKNLVTLQTTCADQTGERLLEGTALVRPPTAKRPDLGDEWATPEASRPRPASKPRLAVLIEEPPKKHGFLVGQRMTPNPVTVSADATLGEARALMDQHGIRHLPVVRREALVGMLTEADISQASRPAARGIQDPTDAGFLILIKVRDVMRRDVVTIGPAAGIGEASALFVSRKVGELSVVEDGRLVGILTALDAIEALVGLVKS